MKYLISLLIFLFVINGYIRAQENLKNLSLNLAVVNPVHYVSGYGYKIPTNLESEILLNFDISKRFDLSTGLAFQWAKHERIEPVSHLIWVEGFGYLPTEYANNWNLIFVNVKVPVYLIFALNNFFFESFTSGVCIGRNVFNKLYEPQRIGTFSQIKLNKSNVDLNVGFRKSFLQTNNFSFNISPNIGYLLYLSDKNTWQNNYFFSTLKIGINLKPNL